MSVSPEGRESTWLRRFHPSPESRVRLVCFPHAGGAASYYFTLSRMLAPDVEVLAVQYPGRQERHREPCITSIAGLAEGMADALSSVRRPLAFFGHSMGAIVAFESARRMQRPGGTGPSWLFASGRRAPSNRRGASIHLLDDDGIVAELRRLGGSRTGALDDPELRPVILPPVRCDYQAIETYAWEPGPPVACPITVLSGASDPQVSGADAAAWQEHGGDPFGVRVFPGGHFYLDACWPAVAGVIATSLR